MEVFTQLGIDWRLLIAQGVNIVILIALLYKFLYKPVLKALDTRHAMITRSVQKADEIEVRLKDTTTQQEQLLHEARMQAQEIITQARTIAQAQTDKAVEHTKQEVAQVVAQAKLQIEAEKKKMLAQASGELADIVVQATQAVMRDVSNETVDRSLVQKAIDRLSQVKV